MNNFEGLVAMRVLLGFFEAGLFPGMWQWKYELSRLILDRLRIPHLDVLQAL